jgi:hypothetical protein
MDSIFPASELSLGYLYQVRYRCMLIISVVDGDARHFLKEIENVNTINSLQF